MSVSDSVEDVKAEIRDAIEFHLEGMLEDGLPIPQTSSQADYFGITVGITGDYGVGYADGVTVTRGFFFWDYGDTCLFSLLCAAPRENSSAVPGKLSADLRPSTLKSILRQAGLKE